MTKTPFLLAGAAVLLLSAAPASADQVRQELLVAPTGEAVRVSTHEHIERGAEPDQRIITRTYTKEPVTPYAHHPIGHPNAKAGYATTETTRWSREVVKTPQGRVTTYTSTTTQTPSAIEPAARGVSR